MGWDGWDGWDLSQTTTTTRAPLAVLKNKGETANWAQLSNVYRANGCGLDVVNIYRF